MHRDRKENGAPGAAEEADGESFLKVNRVSVLQDEESWRWSHNSVTALIPLNLHLNMIKMVNFVICILSQLKKTKSEKIQVI